MKKLLLVLSALLIINPVFAKNIKVEVLSDFSTANPPKTWQLKVLEGFMADNGFYVKKGTIIEGDVADVVSPKRLKRNASFKFIPKTYYDSEALYAKKVKRDFVGKYSPRSELNTKTIAKKGAITAGNVLVGAFVAPAVGLVEGAIKNEEGNRAKSAAISAYESTPLSYANKGKELEFSKGDTFIMNFKLKSEDVEETENTPNYTYTISH